MKSRSLTILLIVGLLFIVGASATYAAPPGQEETTYVIQSGDSLWKLAEKYLGSGARFDVIVSATNERHQTDDSFANIADPGVIRPGWKLLIPAEAPAEEAMATAEPTAEPTAEAEEAEEMEAAGVPEQMAGEEAIVVEGLQFPEAPYWSTRDSKLYFLEWGGDTIWEMQDGQAQVMLELEPGDGPSGLFQDAEGNLWVALYSSLQVVRMTPAGEILQTFDNYEGEPFRGPNDLVVDSKGGVYFTDSGNFEEDWTEGRAVGAVYYITPEGELMQVDSELVYPNGVFTALDEQSLYVNEHRQNRILKYAINEDGSLSEPEVFFEPDDNYLGDAEFSYELGTDGMWRDSQGNLWVAHYGGGKILVLNSEGQLVKQIMLPRGIYPTNTTLGPDEQTLYVTESGEGLLYSIPVE